MDPVAVQDRSERMLLGVRPVVSGLMNPGSSSAPSPQRSGSPASRRSSATSLSSRHDARRSRRQRPPRRTASGPPLCRPRPRGRGGERRLLVLDQVPPPASRICSSTAYRLTRFCRHREESAPRRQTPPRAPPRHTASGCRGRPSTPARPPGSTRASHAWAVSGSAPAGERPRPPRPLGETDADRESLPAAPPRRARSPPSPAAARRGPSTRGLRPGGLGGDQPPRPVGRSGVIPLIFEDRGNVLRGGHPAGGREVPARHPDELVKLPLSCALPRAGPGRTGRTGCGSSGALPPAA